MDTDPAVLTNVTEAYQPCETLDGDVSSGIVLLCDHARNTVPEDYGTLGLETAEFKRHIAYDIGTEALTRELNRRLGVPAVLSNFSRLLIDPNRGEDDPTVVMRLSDGTVIPGNHPITEDEIQTRLNDFYRPYHQMIDDVLDQSLASGVVPMVLSIHSFTPSWKGEWRPWQAAILWDSDPRFSQVMIDGLRRDPDLLVGDNEPYDGALKNDTMYRHCTMRGLAHALLEVRQDLIADDDGVQQWADMLVPLLEEANGNPALHEIKHYRSRADSIPHEDQS